MFQAWRVQLRRVEEALERSQLEEAAALLRQGGLDKFQPAEVLAHRLGARLIERGRQRLADGELSAAAQDWELAVNLGVQHHELQQLEHELWSRWLGEVSELLAADQPQMALARLDELTARRMEWPQGRRLRLVAAKVTQALEAERRGKFAEAETHWEAAVALEGGLAFLPARREACHRRAEQARALSRQLHEHLNNESWNQALAIADEMLALAPDEPVARQARRRAWEKVGAPVADSRPRTVPPPLPNAAPCPNTVPTVQAELARPRTAPQPVIVDTSRPSTGDTQAKGQRYLFWIDAVGGYLVCRGNRLVVGQPAPGHSVDIPIMGDLSSRHAVIHRSGEGYLIEPVRAVRLDGQPLSAATALRDGALVELGSAVKLRFRQPHPLSATARLEFVSRHRTQPPTDGVVLMADSCVLGPSPQSHIVCPNWTHEVLVYRGQDELRVKAPGAIEVDGAACESEAALGPNGHVVADDWAFSVEELKQSVG